MWREAQLLVVFFSFFTASTDSNSALTVFGCFRDAMMKSVLHMINFVIMRWWGLFASCCARLLVFILFYFVCCSSVSISLDQSASSSGCTSPMSPRSLTPSPSPQDWEPTSPPASVQNGHKEEVFRQRHANRVQDASSNWLKCVSCHLAARFNHPRYQTAPTSPARNCSHSRWDKHWVV